MTFTDVFSWEECVSFMSIPNLQYLTIKIFDLDTLQIILFENPASNEKYTILKHFDHVALKHAILEAHACRLF